MRMKKTAGKCLAVLLSLCLIISTWSVAAFADTEETEESVMIQEETSEEGMQDTDESEYQEETGQDESETILPEENTDPTADTETLEDLEKEEEIQVEEEITEEAKNSEEEEESEFEETGVFGITVTDRNGSTVHPWFDSAANIYYLFLTNAVSISELELQVTGIRMAKTSKGKLDSKTNVITGAFSGSGDGITLTAADGNKYNVVIKQSGIPSLSITLNGTTRQTIDSGSKTIKYPGQSVIITDATGEVNVSQSDVEIKGRGNTSWDCSEKKPYQIKFSKKQSVLGMAKAKKWVLLANSFDDSLLRNKTAYYLGDALGMTYSPDLEYVDVWIDGEYRGTYTIGEKCEIDNNRLYLEDSLGALVEYDKFFYAQEDYWYTDSVMGTKFSLAESVDENQGQAALNNFKSKMDAFDNYVFNTNPSSITLAGLKKYIDVESAAKWYLVNEYMSNVESYSTSWFWYCDGPSDQLHLGPLWDFDTSQGIPKGWTDTTLMYGKTYNNLFSRLMNSPEFAAYVKKIYSQYRSAFSSLSGLATVWGNRIASSAECNYTRWQWLGGENDKGKPFATTYAGAVAYLANWLASRDSNFGINVPAAPSANTSVTISETGRYMTVKATEVTGTTSLSVAVWNAKNNQDDLKWYTLSKKSDGSYSVKIDLTKHGSSDTYYAHVYSGATCLGEHTKAVTMSIGNPTVSASYQADTDKIKITVKGIRDFDGIQTAIWTEVDDQDDLKWITKTVNSANEISFTVDRSYFTGSGDTNVHVYGTMNSKQKFLCKIMFDLPEQGEPEITAVQTDGGNVLDILAKNMTGCTKVQAAVWGAKNDQNDLKWYSLTKNEDGSWSKGLDLTSHNETGKFYVHIYAVKNSKKQFIGGVEVSVVKPAAPLVTVKTLTEGVKLQAILKNASSLDSVSFAVWGEDKDQNDLKWYSGKKNEDGSWTAAISLSNHQETGTYLIHAYGTKNGKQTFQAAATCEVEELKCTYLTANVSPSGRTMVATIENASSYQSASFAVWGKTNDQNDLKWYTAKKNMDGSFSVTIDLAAHKETGLYYVHAYAVQDGKNSCVAQGSVTVNSFAKPVVSAVNKGTSFQAIAANTDDYTKVRFAIWTEKKDQDDLKWYTAAKYSDGSYRYIPNIAYHGGNGTYIIHAYGTKNGKESFIASCSFVKSDIPKPEVEVQLKDGSAKLSITVHDTIGYSSISAAVWGDVNGQNDLKWYTLKTSEAGVNTASVDLAAHKEKGKYYIHIYGSYGGKQYYMAGTSIVLD